MFGRNVDFFAVFAIGLGLLAVSHVRALNFPADSFRIENISTNLQACPQAMHALSRIASQLNR
ncbi:MAG TPA: hypothetical protein VKX49_10595 [Bryobacteraceae bacterium]|nr:hypothetical protein [Bryobacteraceae bacterium]